ncbi:DNA polymerase I [Sulfurospirillum oryzae]|uniref:DNA polymerase I n=1 Tax=Sulfurospirillum oryzae TaxID=2976535 RepID=UPI0021E89099|nr:DNA polymerase I [Sulfurospirillum oryzae]
MKTLTIIDTFGFFFRNYYALPQLRNSQGFPTGLLTGFANFIYAIKNEHDTDYLMFALDSKGKNFRHTIDPNYKANRPEAPEDLKRQLPVAVSWIEKMGFKFYSEEGFEADDVIASAVAFAKSHDIKVRIVTHDKDLYQLIDDGRVVIYDPMKKIEIDTEKCFEKFGVYPNKINEYLSLVGDVADNIPGVKGIGPKGAKKLLDDFGSVENVYANLERVSNPRVQSMLEEGREKAFLSKQLVRLDDSLIIADKFESFHFPCNNPLINIVDELEKYELRHILSRVKNESLHVKPKETPSNRFKAILLDDTKMLFNIIEGIEEDAIVAFDTETNALDAYNAKIVGFSFAINAEEAYYVPIAHHYLGVGDQISLTDAKHALEELFKHKIVGQNLKFDLAVIENNFGLKDVNIYADTMLLAWLLNPETSVGLDTLALRFFNHAMVKFKDVVQKGENFSNVPLEKACEYASEDAWMTLRLYHKLHEMLDPHLLDLAKEVEFPFIKTLMKMEKEGIQIDGAYFEKLLKRTDLAIEALKAEIFTLCDATFNLNSTQQLGNVLFEQLGLPTVKKTKTGYSTDENVLNELLDKHPSIAKILEYRELYKLRSTYIEPLLKLSKESPLGRVHTSFMQTGTSTGRLSSKDPNLQNIPVKTELGREVRGGFVAKEGYKLIGIDYSQIELRLLAHFSGDEAMVHAFQAGKDIHKETALKLFGEEEAAAKRGVAKSINFGLLYGMGPKRLSETIGITTKEAKSYIESYFATFPTIKNYLTSVAESAKKEGYVQTLLGRKRFFDFEHANAMQYAGYLREAVNTVFQGSAADLIKLAMNKIMTTLVDDEAKLLLQIHDELIFEVKEERAESFAIQAQKVMEEIYTLKVPLKVSIAIGNNWGELK